MSKMNMWYKTEAVVVKCGKKIRRIYFSKNLS